MISTIKNSIKRTVEKFGPVKTTSVCASILLGGSLGYIASANFIPNDPEEYTNEIIEEENNNE